MLHSTTLRGIGFLFLLLLLTPSLKATNYYINSVKGNDAYGGTSAKRPWKTISRVMQSGLKPGDSILLATGQRFSGMLSLINISGQEDHPIVIGSYPFNNSTVKPVLDAGDNRFAILIRNASFIKVQNLELTATTPFVGKPETTATDMRCSILVEVTENNSYGHIELRNLSVHDVFYQAPGFVRDAGEIKSANGTQPYGWGIRFINNTSAGILTNLLVANTDIYRVSHTGLKCTGTVGGIRNLEVANCNVHHTGGPGMQFSGVADGHIHHNSIDHSGSRDDSRNWGRGSGLWTWSCSNILIEHNRFEHANGPGDSAGVHIDYNCNDVIVQYNFSSNNAGGFCEILGNNHNCAYRYNISVNDGYRVKGMNGAFQEGKIFWLSGYQGNEKKNAGPYNSYFYNNTIYVSDSIVPKIAVSSSADGVLIANNIFYFEKPARMVEGDQKKKEIDPDGVPNVLFTHNLFLQADSWPSGMSLQDSDPRFGDPGFSKKGGRQLADYLPLNISLVRSKGIPVPMIPHDSIGLRVGLAVSKDILGNPVPDQPGLGAIEVSKSTALTKQRKPNVIIILTDDQGYGDVGFNGCKDIPTPNIDRLARNGMIFRNAYVSYSVCAPSRAGLLTGRYQDRFGYSRNPLYKPADATIGLSLQEQLLPDLLRQGGYNTMGIGKWHLGAHPQFRPWRRGFNEYFGFIGGGHRYFPEDYTIADEDSANNETQSYHTKLVRNGKPVEETSYITDALSREAVAFVERNQSSPFFLYLASNAPHAPLQATQKYLDRFPDIRDPKRRTYAAMVSAVDDGVGKLLDKLDELKLIENTIVVFLSDNGGPMKDNASSNAPLRGGKGSLFDGGIRVPFAIQWPQQIRPGSEYHQSISSLDIFATLVANIDGLPHPKNTLDGVNLLPYLKGTSKGAPHEYLFWRGYDQKNYAVLHGSGYKEVILHDTAIQLYHLPTDTAEQKNLAGEQQPLLQQMQRELKQWEAGTIPPQIFGLNQEAAYNRHLKPNIIVMLVDDAGYADFGFMGSKDLQTPNIDQLAANAIRFTDAHVSASVCSPSRAGLLTGRYQQRFGYECNDGPGYPGLDTLQTMLPLYLQQQGYHTAAMGKWHLGFEPGQHPLQKGFQYFYGFLSGSRSYFYRPEKDDRPGAKNALLENHTPVPFDGYLTDRLGDQAAAYIRKNADHPFFLYWAPNAVHTPLEASPEDLERFAHQPRQQLKAMSFALDRAVGKIIAELRQQGIFDNTVIFFLSDNGGAHDNQSSNLPLKGFKGNEYEAGHRVPFFISWPGKFAAGATFEGLSSSLDIFPTALELAGISTQPPQGLDGVSLLPFLDGRKGGNPHQLLAWRKGDAAAIRINDYKLLRVKGIGERLYDLKKDPGETLDLQNSKTNLRAQLEKALSDWEKDKIKPIWTEGATWDTITLMIHDDLMHNRNVRVRNPGELDHFRSLNKPKMP